jgi:hypothetical protein
METIALSPAVPLPRRLLVRAAAALLVLAVAGPATADCGEDPSHPAHSHVEDRSVAAPRSVSAVVEGRGALLLAQAAGTERRELQPRYEPAPVEPESSYNSSYIFGLTRGLADSTISPAGKAPLFLFTVPLDFVFLPFAAIGGFFG